MVSLGGRGKSRGDVSMHGRTGNAQGAGRDAIGRQWDRARETCDGETHTYMEEQKCSTGAR